MRDKIYYLLQLADNALIYGHRLGEWCGHGPVLEQDIALTNISLDYLGQARSLYQYAAVLFNDLPSAEKSGVFRSVALEQKINKGEMLDEDDLAFLRDGWDFRNLLLTEQKNGDWAVTIARAFFFDTFNQLYFTTLKKSSDTQVAAIAEKSLKEITYHVRWSTEWIIRLGDGTDISHSKIADAINELWTYTGEMFVNSAAEQQQIADGVAVDCATLKDTWMESTRQTLAEATLALPDGDVMQTGGKTGRHTEHLGYILAEMQYMQRTYPDMEW